MALGKPSPLSIILAVILIGIIGYLIYVATTNVDTSTETYAGRASHTETTTTYSPIYNAYPLSVPPLCGSIFKIDAPGIPITTNPKAVKK